MSDQEPYARSNSDGVSRSGDTLPDAIRLIHDPIEDTEAATKRYVDERLIVGQGGVIPLRVGGWFLPTEYRTDSGSVSATNVAVIMPLFAGRAARWDRMAVAGPSVNGVNTVQLGLYHLNDRTLYPTARVWTSGSVVATANFAANVHSESMDVTTTTKWIGLGFWTSATGTLQFRCGGVTRGYSIHGASTSTASATLRNAHWAANTGAGGLVAADAATWLSSGLGGGGSGPWPAGGPRVFVRYAGGA